MPRDIYFTEGRYKEEESFQNLPKILGSLICWIAFSEGTAQTPKIPEMKYYENIHTCKLPYAQNLSQLHIEAIFLFYSMWNSFVIVSASFALFVYFQGDSETQLVVLLLLKSNDRKSSEYWRLNYVFQPIFQIPYRYSLAQFLLHNPKSLSQALSLTRHRWLYACPARMQTHLGAAHVTGWSVLHITSTSMEGPSWT